MTDTGKEGYVGKFPSAAADPSDKDSKKQPKRGKYDGLSRKVKRRKMAIDADEAEGRAASQNASIRAAKKAARPVKIGVPVPRSAPVKAKKPQGGRKSAFDERKKGGAGGAGGGGHEGMRAKPVKVSLTKGKAGKSKGGSKGAKGSKGGKTKGGRR